MRARMKVDLNVAKRQRSAAYAKPGRSEASGQNMKGSFMHRSLLRQRTACYGVPRAAYDARHEMRVQKGNRVRSKHLIFDERDSLWIVHHNDFAIAPAFTKASHEARRRKVKSHALRPPHLTMLAGRDTRNYGP